MWNQNRDDEAIFCLFLDEAMFSLFLVEMQSLSQEILRGYLLWATSSAFRKVWFCWGIFFWFVFFLVFYFFLSFWETAVHHYFSSEVLCYYFNINIYLCTQWTWVINHLEDQKALKWTWGSGETLPRSARTALMCSSKGCGFHVCVYCFVAAQVEQHEAENHDETESLPA